MKRWFNAIGAIVAGAAVLVLAGPAAAETPGEGALAQLAGDIPATGEIARLTTTEVSTAQLVDDLTAAGCVPDFLAVESDAGWRLAVKGVPAFALASFPTSVDGAFWVRCDAPSDEFTLTILHHNDGESQLTGLADDRSDFGGIARFASLADRLRLQAALAVSGPSTSILASAGDNFLAGPEFNASLDRGVPFYDALGMDLIDYDVLAIGNHEFDFGPDVLADFINSFSGGDERFVSANLDVSGEPGLQALADQGLIAPSIVIEKAGRQIGIVGATTPNLPFISSPRNVAVNADVAAAVQAEVDALQAQGVNIIILVSHLQGLSEDRALIPQLRGVDVAIAGGGDELLASESSLLIPGDEAAGPYPTLIADADGNEVPVVTGPGDYAYLGRLVAEFTTSGVLTSIDMGSGPVRVSGAGSDAVEADAAVLAAAVTPVEAFVNALATTTLGTSEVALNGERGGGVRTQETNLGNLMADSALWQAQELASSFGVASPTVAIQNGGGIRNNSVIPAGEITELTTWDIAPFANFIAIVPDLTPAEFKAMMENAVADVENVGGRFGQIAGFTVVYDADGPARTHDAEGNVTAEGSRVVSITLADGTQLVANGQVVTNAPNVSLATIDFLARGGDLYPLAGKSFTSVGVTYQQALQNYIEGELGGQITAAQYPEAGSGRITAQ